MMKKLLVLTLVLGMAVLANAGIVTQLTPGLSVDVDMVAQTITFVGSGAVAAGPDSVTGLGLNLQASIGTIEYVGPTTGLGELSPGFEYPAPGTWTGYAASDTNGKIGSFVAFHYSEPLTLVTIVNDPDFGNSEVAFRSGAIVSLAGMTIVPEPMTMLLLGLGGLFLRKK